MSVAGKVFDDVGGGVKRILDIDKEICFVERIQKILIKSPEINNMNNLLKF